MIRTFILVFFSITLSQSLLSQVEEGSRSKLKLNSISDQKDIWSLEFGSSALINSSLKTSRFNFVTGLDYFYELNLNNKNSVSLAFGLGYRFKSLSFDGIFLNEYDTSFNFSYTSYNVADVSKSRLNTHKLRVPFELRFLIKDKVKLYLGYGLEFNVGTNNRFKQNDKKETSKNFNDSYFVNNSLKLRVGLSDVFLFAGYNFNPIFRSTNSPILNTLEFGIAFGG